MNFANVAQTQPTGHGNGAEAYVCRETHERLQVPHSVMQVQRGLDHTGHEMLFRSVVECPKHRGEVAVRAINVERFIGLMTNGAELVPMNGGGIDTVTYPMSARGLDLLVFPPTMPPAPQS